MPCGSVDYRLHKHIPYRYIDIYMQIRTVQNVFELFYLRQTLYS